MSQNQLATFSWRSTGFLLLWKCVSLQIPVFTTVALILPIYGTMSAVV